MFLTELRYQAKAILSRSTSESVCISKNLDHFFLPGRLCGDLQQTFVILRPLNLILLQHAPEQAVAQVVLP